MNDRNIILLGFMGTGKTEVGRILAERLGREFMDMDRELEARAGKTVSSIFEEDGEPRFRAMERDLAMELAARRSLVIAAGGGVVLDGRNIRDLSASGILICLEAEPGEILRRVKSDTARPLLACGDREKRISALLESRKDAYARIPNRIDTTHLSPPQVAGMILAMFDFA